MVAVMPLLLSVKNPGLLGLLTNSLLTTNGHCSGFRTGSASGKLKNGGQTKTIVPTAFKPSVSGLPHFSHRFGAVGASS